MTTIDRDVPVLVTGAGGFIASWIVRYLLEAGHTVHGTVRDPQKAKGLEHLHALARRHEGRLELFKADLLSAGSYDTAMQGCQLVIHTASPFLLSGFSDANEALVRPALEGTRNVLESANRSAGVRRVVLTSSVVAIYGDAIDMQQVPGGIYTEAQWNTTSSLDHQPYSYSKLVAEREAWAIAQRQSRWDLVTINPGFVLGPSLTTASASSSLSVMKQLVDGTMFLGAPKLQLGVVDVRDVAMAHIHAGYTPGASGRYITSGREATMLEMGRILRSHFGSRYLFPFMEAPKAVVWLIAPLVGQTRKYIQLNVGYPLRFDNTRSRRELGLEYRPLEQTLADHFEQMLADGIVRRRG